MLQENLRRANTERSDIELIKSKLSNIMLGDTSKPLEQKTTIDIPTPPEPPQNETPNETADETPTEPSETVNTETANDTEETNEAPEDVPEEATELPEPPVVVYVKEVGKAGI